MWRIFRWLDRHGPSFYKLTVMTVGLATVVAAGFLLALIHPAVGIIFAFAAIFALLRASHVYRFEMKESPAVPQCDLPIAQASDDEILRRVRRRANTESLRRHILSLRDEKSKRGDLARSIIKRWEEAGTPDGRPARSEDKKKK